MLLFELVIMKKILDFLKLYKFQILSFCILSVILLISIDSFARMGGAGGGSNSSSDSGDSGNILNLILMLLMLLPEPYNYISILIIIVVAYLIGKKAKNSNSILYSVNTTKIPKENTKAIKAFSLIHPDFNEKLFIDKVKTAFLDIQKSWTDKDIKRVRRYISDGMYQRVMTQFRMMDILKQTNKLESINVKKILIDAIESDDLFDTITVEIHASAIDSFTSDYYPNLNNSFNDEFIEYWTFIRKNSAKLNKDMYSSSNCPNCGGNLNSDMGDMCKCPYCGTITNSGEYDWVLSKITQSYDYKYGQKLDKLSDVVIKNIENIKDENEDFALEIIEDKVSNGYLQIATARVLLDPSYIQRFVSEEFLKKFVDEINDLNSNFVYNRIFLNDVRIIGALEINNKNVLVFSVKCSYQRVIINDSKVIIIDPAVINKTDIVWISRDKNTETNNGSIYAKQCSSCGGSLDDTTDRLCPYCGSELNSDKTDWIIIDVTSYDEHLKYLKHNSELFYSNISHKGIKSIFKVRDFAFNNVLVMIAADGVITDEELAFIKKLANKWGFSYSKLTGMIDLAKNNQLAIRMPENEKDKAKVYKLMLQAAAIDGNISREEQAVLDSVKNF